jgi:hypothetical protein
MFPQVSAKTSCVAGIEKLHATAKYGVFNALMVRSIQLVGEHGPLDVPLQPCPTRKPGLARNGELRVTEAQVRLEDLGIGCTGETRMKFSDSLRRS